MKCHVCADGVVVEAVGFDTLGRTASDGKPWRSGGSIGVCQYCAIVQKIINAKWQTETAEIYSEYNIYHQSPSRSEQPIYIANTDNWIPRSEAVLLNFIEIVGDKILSARKSMDIGCGNGATLQAMAKMLPKHQRYGYDPTATNIGALQSRTDLQLTACSRDLKDLPQNFDLLTMIHVLEHIPEPLPVLKSYVNMLDIDGYFVIVVPNFRDNPFDITTADHCAHFCKDSLVNLLLASGLEIVNLSTTSIPKEIMVVCKKGNVHDLRELPQTVVENTYYLQAQINWLHSICSQVTDIVANTGRFGVFGTSIAGNWLYGAWQKNIDFFVDEDPDRLGTVYRGVPVVSVKDLGANDSVYIALAPAIAYKIKQRYKDAKCKIYIPSEIIHNEDINKYVAV